MRLSNRIYTSAFSSLKQSCNYKVSLHVFAFPQQSTVTILGGRSGLIVVHLVVEARK